MLQHGFNQCSWISLSVNVSICVQCVCYFVSSSVIDASPSPLSQSTVWGGAEGDGGRGAAGARGQAPVSPEHPHPPGRGDAQHPPLPQHRHHSHVTAPFFFFFIEVACKCRFTHFVFKKKNSVSAMRSRINILKSSLYVCCCFLV